MPLPSLQNANPARGRATFLALPLLFLTINCGGPNTASIEVRKQNQALREQIETLERQHNADQASLQAATKPSIPTLPPAQLATLYTTHSIELGRLTGGYDTDNKPGDEGLKIQLSPLDDEGQKLKAAGSITVDLFDLALSNNQRIGHWELPPNITRQTWLGSAFQYNYLIKLPWQTPPQHAELTLKVTFTDALTHRSFTEQKVITITLPK